MGYVTGQTHYHTNSWAATEVGMLPPIAGLNKGV